MVCISLYKKQREHTKNSIIQTSIELFREKGYENVSVDQITTEMEIAKGTFYNFFKSKRDLLMHWSQECFKNVDVMNSTDKAMTTQNNLNSLVKSFVEVISQERALFISFIKETGTTRLIHTEENGDFNFAALLKEVIFNSSDGVSILKSKADLKVQLLNSAIFNAIVEWVLSAKDLSGLVEHIKELIDLCLYGLFEKGERK